MIKFLIQKEFLQIRRNAFLPRLIIMFPVVIMCVMPWVMQMEVKNIRVDVVDIDHSVESQRMVRRIAASNYFIFNGQRATYAEAMKDIEKGRADIILEIRDGRYLIAANAVNGTKGAIGSSYLNQIVASSAIGVSSSAAGVSTPLSVGEGAGVRLLYNPHQDYKLFMIPALLAIVMMLMTGFLPTLNIVGEKEAQTHPLLADSPLRRNRLPPAGLARLWTHACRTALARLCPRHAAGPVLLVARTDYFQLQRHHAAGYLRHVVLHRLHHAAQRSFHPHALYAGLGLPDHLRQPHALLHRCHPHRLHTRRRLPRRGPSGAGSHRHRAVHGCMGRS